MFATNPCTRVYEEPLAEMGTEKSRNPNRLTEVELTDQKTVKLLSRVRPKTRLQNGVDQKRENSYRAAIKVAPAPMLTIIIILAMPSVRFWLWPRFRIQTLI